MKIRVKFSKGGALVFIGHLDIMRYFQKLIRRAQIPIAYSQGMSPHQIMSFALPLGLGISSVAEYMDIEITEPVKSQDAILQMNEMSVEDIQILSFKQLPEDAKNAMAAVTAADYEVRFREGRKPELDFGAALNELLSKQEIPITKKTKKSERTIDIKPFIYKAYFENDVFYFTLSCGSVDNTKPELVMKALCDFVNVPLLEFDLLLKRTELYTGERDSLISLDEIGSDIV